MQLLQVLSDIHIEFHAAPPAIPSQTWAGNVPDVGADVLILAGDIGVGDQGVRWAAREADRLGVPCLYVPGNHEFYRQEHADALVRMRTAAAGTRVRVLDNDQVLLDGVRYLGCTLWTDLTAYQYNHARGYSIEILIERALADYRLIAVETASGRLRRLRASDTLRWNRTSVAWLRQRLREPHDGPTVVITHHGPSRRCVHPGHPDDWVSNAFHSPLIENLAHRDRIAAWLYGHTHAALDTRVHGIRLVSNPRGYPGESVPGGFDPQKVVVV